MVAIAPKARHRYGAAIRGSTEALPTLYPGVERTTAFNTVDTANAKATAPADISVLITGGTGALVTLHLEAYSASSVHCTNCSTIH